MSAESFAPVTPSEPDDFSCDMGHVPNDPNADRSDRLCPNMFQLSVILMFGKFCKVKIGMSAMNSIHRDVRGCLLLSHVLVAYGGILPDPSRQVTTFPAQARGDAAALFGRTRVRELEDFEHVL